MSMPKGSNIGQFVVIEEGVKLGENVTIGHHTVILKDTVIGDNVTIGCNCVVGVRKSRNQNMRISNSSLDPLVIQANCKIGNHVSIYSGTTIAQDVFIADHASIRENVEVGPGTIIGRGAIIELNTKIGHDCTIQTLAYVTGDTTIEDHVFIGPCVSMSNDKYMGAREYTLKGPYIQEGAKIGNNATLLPGITIGSSAVVGAGSVVTKDVADFKTVVGSPAKDIRYLVSKEVSEHDTTT
ncbi:N-acetyltransferase [Siminovitchia acidinfaciens]|uniref:N-acetyltransferase n=1 Tax=Siminovitchia acidinfaciens TaxID=2321395 RepID=A0A429XV65_9BACI|nr:acyltransferase [Siminovitchia acidinfaciens]RST72079.1 N-acetyltransferase [Siminovitchia acidinfaciens]